MDFQNRAGSKPGSAGVAGGSESNVDRRERLRKLALETIDLAKDPYFMKNHLGSYECKLCLTLHSNEGSYLAHTQGKKHQTNLARRAAREQQQAGGYDGTTVMAAQNTAIVPKRNFIKIGRPGYKIAKIKDPMTRHLGLLFQISLLEIGLGVLPRHRFMSSFEQRSELPNKAYQYLLVAAEPYETIAFKVQSRQPDDMYEKCWSYWDVDTKTYWIQIVFKNEWIGGQSHAASNDVSLQHNKHASQTLPPNYINQGAPPHQMMPNY